MYEDTVKWESRYLCGPRLASELTGAAKAAISNKKRGWLSTTNGVAKLLNCLRETMSEPALPEIANQLRTYFRLFRRRKGEAMTAFCARHREEYARTCKALTRVMREQQTLQHQGRHAWRSGRVGGTGSRGPSTAGSSRGGQRDPGGDRLETAVNAEQDEESGEFQDAEDEESQSWWQASEWYSSQTWSHRDWHYDGWQTWDWPDDDDEEDFVEILPEPIKGWLLLDKAGLDQMEKSLIKVRCEVNSI